MFLSLGSWKTSRPEDTWRRRVEQHHSAVGASKPTLHDGAVWGEQQDRGGAGGVAAGAGHRGSTHGVQQAADLLQARPAGGLPGARPALLPLHPAHLHGCPGMPGHVAAL